MILENDGITFELKLKNLKVGLQLPLTNQAASASTSSTDTTNTGTKAMTLSVAGVLPYDDSDHFKKLIKLASAIDETGARKVYTISDGTATAADIRQVIFDSDFSAFKAEELEAWNVSFSLLQKKSVAEAKEERLASTNVVTDTATGMVVGSDDDINQQIDEKMGTIYQLLKKLDKWLEPTA